MSRNHGCPWPAQATSNGVSAQPTYLFYIYAFRVAVMFGPLGKYLSPFVSSTQIGARSPVVGIAIFIALSF
jgi:hypothetical protein